MNMEKNVCLFALFAICGASAVSINSDNRITNGSTAVQNQFQYAVSLQLISGASQPTRGHRCGGTLITLQHAVTAATCLIQNPSTSPPTLNAASLYRVFAGSVNLNLDNDQERIRPVLNFTIHPDFRAPPALNNDIGIVILAVPFARNVQVLPLPSANFRPTEGTQCSVAGWGGRNSSSIASNELQHATKFIHNQLACTLHYNLIQQTVNILSNMICTLPQNGLSSGCHGDEGNALVCGGTLTGILSVSNSCGSMVLPNPEVYVQVSNYTTWIRSVTGGASTFQPGLAVLILFTFVHLLSAKVIS